MVDHLVADDALPLVSFNPPGCNTHVRGYGGLLKPMSQIKNKLIILDSIFIRMVNDHNIVITTHEKIYYKLAHSVTEYTIYITSNRNQRSVSWIKRLNMMHLTSSMACKR